MDDDSGDNESSKVTLVCKIMSSPVRQLSICAHEGKCVVDRSSSLHIQLLPKYRTTV